jgi:hypothetical protein
VERGGSYAFNKGSEPVRRLGGRWDAMRVGEGRY